LGERAWRAVAPGRPLRDAPSDLLHLLSQRDAVRDAFYHHRFRLYDDEHGVLLCKDLEIHLIELSKFDVAVEEVKTPLERWCYFFKHGASLDPDNLPETLAVPAIRQAMEVLMRISQSEIDRQRILERQRAERDAANLREEARVARQEGREEGELVGSIRLLQQLRDQTRTPREDLHRLSLDELKQMMEALQPPGKDDQQTNGAPPADQP
jgi:predicted transposase/invertase (TIGR01784 family)